MFAHLIAFKKSEEGAITVDWVVLTGGLIIFGVLVASSIASGATEVSSGTGAVLSAAPVPVVAFN